MKKRGRLKFKKFRIKTWQLILVLIPLFFLDATLLRWDHVKMTELAAAVIEADKDGNEEELVNSLERLREFVRKGGTLIVTGATGIYDYYGNPYNNFALSDVMGVDFLGEYSPKVNYTGEELILSDCEAPLGKVTGAKPLAYFNFPIYPVNDPYEYASIHSNPPGRATGYPAITENRFGEGKCVWIGASFILKKQFTQKEFAKKIYKKYIDCHIETDLPYSVELTVLEGNGKKSVCVVNMQDQYPPLPIYDRYIMFEAEKPKRIIKASDGQEACWEYTGSKVKITIDKLSFAEFFVME